MVIAETTPGFSSSSFYDKANYHLHWDGPFYSGLPPPSQPPPSNVMKTAKAEEPDKPEESAKPEVKSKFVEEPTRTPRSSMLSASSTGVPSGPSTGQGATEEPEHQSKFDERSMRTPPSSMFSASSTGDPRGPSNGQSTTKAKALPRSPRKLVKTKPPPKKAA